MSIRLPAATARSGSYLYRRYTHPTGRLACRLPILHDVRMATTYQSCSSFSCPEYWMSVRKCRSPSHNTPSTRRPASGQSLTGYSIDSLPNAATSTSSVLEWIGYVLRTYTMLLSCCKRALS